jgi:hypothetical protein
VTSVATAFSSRRLVGVGFEHKKIDDQLMRVTAIWTRQNEELITKLNYSN